MREGWHRRVRAAGYAAIDGPGAWVEIIAYWRRLRRTTWRLSCGLCGTVWRETSGVAVQGSAERHDCPMPPTPAVEASFAPGRRRG
jgi:hypothetical protein